MVGVEGVDKDTRGGRSMVLLKDLGRVFVRIGHCIQDDKCVDRPTPGREETTSAAWAWASNRSDLMPLDSLPGEDP